MFKKNNTKYEVRGTIRFKKQFKKSIKQGKDISKLVEVLNVLGNGNKLKPKYKNHYLINDQYYKDCQECHIEPNWLLIYKYNDEEMILYLIGIGTHSELFNK